MFPYLSRNTLEGAQVETGEQNKLKIEDGTLMAPVKHERKERRDSW